MTTFFSVREQFFIEKTVIFLKGFENIDEDFRNKLDKAISEEKYKQDLEERLIIALDRFDEPEKATALFNFLSLVLIMRLTIKSFCGIYMY